MVQVYLTVYIIVWYLFGVNIGNTSHPMPAVMDIGYATPLNRFKLSGNTQQRYQALFSTSPHDPIFHNSYSFLFFCLLLPLSSPLLFPCARYPMWDTHPVNGIPVPQLQYMLNGLLCFGLKIALSLVYNNNITKEQH